MTSFASGNNKSGCGIRIPGGGRMGRRPLCLFVLLIIGALLALNLIGADFVPVTAAWSRSHR